MKSTADTFKETSRKLMDYHLGTGRLPDWNDLFQGFSAAQELLSKANAQPKLLRVQRAWFKDQQSGTTVEIVISSDAQVDWLGVNELLIRGCSKPWVRVPEEVARNMLTEGGHCICGALLWFQSERESGYCQKCAPKSTAPSSSMQP